MLSKKISIQKSFRIEANMESDLEALSVKLNRPQNELVNVALNQLLLDNMGWFAEDYLIDLCMDFLEKKVAEVKIDITGFKLHLRDTGKAIKIDYVIDNNSFIEKCQNGIFVNDEMGYAMIKNELKEIALKIGIDSPEIQEYLHNRFGYIYSNERNIYKFDREKFIRQSVGEEPMDSEYRAITGVAFPANHQEE